MSRKGKHKSGNVRMGVYVQPIRKAICAPVAARGMKVPSGAKALGEQDVCAMVVDDLKITFGIEATETVNAGE